jgi:acyl-CoA synthetase (NDP forming)
MTNLHKITVNLIDKADRALSAAAEREGLNRTDTINRALQFYDYFSNETAEGAEVLIHKNGETSRLRWFA